MRRISGIATVKRALAGSIVAQPRPAHTAPLRTYSSSYASNFFQRLVDHLGINPSLARGVTGKVFFSAAASPLAQDILAKEPPRSQNFLPKEVVLYQYEACPFCNKVKAFLDYNKIPYKVVEVNSINKKEIKWSEYKKVPVLTVDGEHMVDSSDIIDKLSEKIHPDTVTSSDEEEKKRRGSILMVLAIVGVTYYAAIVTNYGPALFEGGLDFHQIHRSIYEFDLLNLFRSFSQGIDLKAGGKSKKTKRTAPMSKDVYLKLLVNLYRFLVKRTGSKFNAVILKRLFMSKVNNAPLSLSRLVSFITRKDGKIAVIDGTVADDNRVHEVPTCFE